MKLEQSFEVAAPIEQVWQTLIDVEHVAPCLPGAAVTGRNDDGSYNGTFTVKIGPTTASYTGKLEMETIDEASHTATMQAQGTDKRGQGGAKATIASRLAQVDGRGTRVEVVTDYHITGRLARFGRGGMIEDISERLLKEFAKRLQSELAAQPEAVAAPAAAEPAAAAEPGAAEPAAAAPTAPEPPRAADTVVSQVPVLPRRGADRGVPPATSATEVVPPPAYGAPPGVVPPRRTRRRRGRAAGGDRSSDGGRAAGGDRGSDGGRAAGGDRGRSRRGDEREVVPPPEIETPIEAAATADEPAAATPAEPAAPPPPPAPSATATPEEPAAPPPPTAAETRPRLDHPPQPSEPLQGLTLVGSVLWGRVKRNPAPVAAAGVAVVLLIARRRRRRH